MQTCIMSSLPHCIFRCSVFRYVTLVSFVFLFKLCYLIVTLLLWWRINTYLLTYLKIDLDGDNTKVAKTDKLDVKHKVKDKPDIRPNKGDKQDVKPVIKPNKEHKQDVKPNRPDIKQNIEISRSKPDTNKITYEEEKAALILGTTAVFTVWWMLK